MPDAPDFPLATAALALLLQEQTTAPATAPAPFRLGPAVLRAPPAAARPRQREAAGHSAAPDDDAPETADLLGELLDMVLVGADDADSGLPEVHLQFKASIFGGLHLRLVKKAQGLDATFVVADAAARREVAAHVEELVLHLKARGFALLSHELKVQGA